jgi:1,2-dihydroxy-3-keto-5-methylthiopentene dioxygenase
VNRKISAMAETRAFPEAWYMAEVPEGGQKAENRLSPNHPATAEKLVEIGINYWKLDAGAYEYPVKAVPWDPKESPDPALSKLRDDRGYSYADIITIHPDHLPDFASKVKAFFEEHIHDAEEIRFVLGGSGFFDVRDASDAWIRIHVKAGDLITLPEGIYHRFTCDASDYIHAMRLFQGQPVWTPFNRPQEAHPSRQAYVAAHPSTGAGASAALPVSAPPAAAPELVVAAD